MCRTLLCSVVVVVACALGATAAEATEWFVAPGGTGAGTSAAPFPRIQDGLNAAQPGDTVTIARGTYSEVLATARHGSANARITLRAADGPGSVVVTSAGRVLTVNHAYVTVDGLVFDGQYGLNDTVRITSSGGFFRLAHSEVRRSTYDLIDMGGPQGVVIEHCLIHHALNAAGGRTDAHGIVAGTVQDLTIRDTEIHTFSGDGVQVDPGRSAPGWSRVMIERAKIWLAPLPAAENGFAAGTVTGENAVDTKASASYPRAVIVIRDTTASGFRAGLIGNMAAFNLKEHIDATVDRVLVFNSEIAFRLRGAATGGASVAVKNAVVYDTLTAFRYEDEIQNLRIWNSTIGRGVTRVFQDANSSSAGLDVRNLLVLGTLPGEAAGSSNLAVGSDAFVSAAQHNYALTATSAAVDAGVAITAVTTDFDGVARPQGSAYDIGAFEYASSAANQPPVVALTSPNGGAVFTAPANIVLSADASDPDGAVAEVAFYANGTLVARDTTAPYSVTAGSVAAGSYLLTAIATDGTGATTTSGQVQIRVDEASTPVATWTFTANPSTIRRTQSSLLSFTTTATTIQNVFINGVRPAYSCSSSGCTGSLTVKPTTTTTYKLTASDAANEPYPPLSVTVTVKGGRK